MAADADLYLAQRIREALALDPEIAELGITVSVSGDHVLLTGDVATPERKEALAAAAAPLVEGRTLQNAVTVATLAPAEGEEAIP